MIRCRDRSFCFRVGIKTVNNIKGAALGKIKQEAVYLPRNKNDKILCQL